MTLVRNLLQQLSGSKILFSLCIILFGVVHSISAKNAKDASIQVALILPLNFHTLDPNSLLDQKSFDASNVGIDFYRGMKIALDSLSKNGYTYNVKVFDSESDTNKLISILSDPFLCMPTFCLHL